MSTPLPGPLKHLLDSPVFVVIGTVEPDGSPQLTVVWAGRDGDQIVFVTGRTSRKAANLARDPRVSVLVNPPEAPYTYAFVSGTAVRSDEDGAKLLDDLSVKYSGKPYAEFSPGSELTADDLVVFRVTAARVAGSIR